MAELALEVREVSKRFRIYHQRSTSLKEALVERRRGRYEEFWAVRDISVDVPPGHSLGIIGENGSGKSTLLKCMAGILVQDKGTIVSRGRLASLLEVGAGFHPDFSGRENIYLNGAILGLPRRYINAVLDEIVGFAELEQFIDNPVKTYSSGMYTRLGFSIAVHLDPEILLIDEVLAVGDEAFQRRCMARIRELRSEGRTLVFVTHSLESVRAICDRCLWMDRSRCRMLGEVDAVLAGYRAELRAREEAELAMTEAAVVDSSPGRDGFRITSLGIIGPEGPTSILNTGDQVTISVGYSSPAPLSGAKFAITLLSEGGAPLATVRTADLETADLSLPQEGTVRLVLPGLPLLEGLYRLTVEVADIASGERYKRLDGVQPFRVHSEGRRESGMALLGHSWEFPRVTEATAGR